MTSTVRISSTRGGFTLIEIVLVLVIAVMMLGGAVGAMYYSSDERAIKDTFSSIEGLAKRARTIAILQQTPYALEFRPDSVRLLPLAQAGQDETLTALGQTVGGETVETNSPNGPVHDRIPLNEPLTVFIRHWNSEEWLPMSDRFIHVWRFDPDGLCEPIGVRVVIGDNQMEGSYHPLTATVRETILENP